MDLERSVLKNPDVPVRFFIKSILLLFPLSCVLLSWFF